LASPTMAMHLHSSRITGSERISIQERAREDLVDFGAHELLYGEHPGLGSCWGFRMSYADPIVWYVWYIRPGKAHLYLNL